MDCETPVFIPGDAERADTRCERCLRKYFQQLELLREFMRHPQ